MLIFACPVAAPVAIVGAGASVDGDTHSLATGYAWGEREEGLFAGVTVSRVLFAIREDEHAHRALSLTYGWYETQIMSAGIDFGAEATRDGAGPTTRWTIGLHGIALQLTGGVRFEPSPHPIGAAQLVLEVDELAGLL